MKNVCPECGGEFTVWFDVNTEVRYTVSKRGSLSKAKVLTSNTGEERFGIDCNSCSWEIHGSDDEIENYEDIISQCFQKTEGVEFVIKKTRRN